MMSGDIAMNPRVIFRFVIYVTAIFMLIVLIAWTALTSWRRIGVLHQQFTTKQWESFQIADHLQKAILGLDNLILRYAAYRDPDDWTNFCLAGSELDSWINKQQPILTSQEERPFLGQINVAFKDYQAAASAINVKIYTSHQSITRVVEFTDLEKQSKRMLDLGIQLSKAHQQAVDQSQAQNISSLNVLRFQLLGALALLFIAVYWFAIVFYREMFRPLKVQLVESRQLLERQEKLASLGMLAAGVAHEIRNPLTAIKGWLFLQLKHLSPGTPEFADAKIIGSEINRLERIVKDFLQFARPSEPQFALVTVEQPLREVQELLKPELDKFKIKLVLEKIVQAKMRADAQQIKQVLINLVQNAADSIGERGTVTLRARLDVKRLNERLTDVVILEVNDTGKGIPPEAEKRLFDPFFTTKDFGTGLGLPIAARIIEKHQGALQYQTETGHGTTFGVVLPVHKT